MKPEYLARTGIIAVIVVVIGLLWWGYTRSSATLVLTGSMPESGGWQPGVIKARVGEPLQLQMTSNDVVHGFAVGQMYGTEAEVLPGKITNLSLTFHEPGNYTYYCTRWCGPNHWRMRGTIEVEGEEPLLQDEKTPLYLKLGVDIDADHPAGVIPSSKPSAQPGEPFLRLLPEKYFAPEVYLSNSPAALFQKLRGEEGLDALNDEKIWDLVAVLYWSNTTRDDLIKGEQLYTDNCAACHGTNGEGNGIFAQAPDLQETPTDFTDPNLMLGASSSLLQGKIIRGGMGTSMPYWGTIFTEDQTWSLVDYLWSFQFEYLFDK
jgi:plastocyanin